MTQSSGGTAFTLTPAVRAGRLAERLKGKCLRSGGAGAALHEIGVLDSGALTALPRLSADLLRFQEQEPLPADPLRLLTAVSPPGGRPGGRIWNLGKKSRPEVRTPVLSGAQWQSWQAEIQQTGQRLARQWEQLTTFQARQEQLLVDLQTDALILTQAGQTLLTDPELPELWRNELAQAMRERALDVGAALEVAGQLGSAVRLLLSNHALMQGRLLAATQLLLYAAQTGLTLQQALDAQVGLEALPEFQLALPPAPPAFSAASAPGRQSQKDQE